MPQTPNKNTRSAKPPASSTPRLPSSPANRGLSGLWLRLVALVLLIGVLGGLFFYRQPIYDWWRLRSYQPPAAIQQLVSQTTMTDYARRLFYINRPELLSSVDTFRKRCPDSQDTVVLGCYHPKQRGIYIYDVKEPDLQGITQVTAAHEDLHAAYDRLSDKDRQYVNGLLQDYYDHGLTDARVKSQIQLYQKTEPDDILDEMHSTFGTEITDLPPALEEYYKRYFINRAVVATYEKQYEQAFTARQQVLQADDSQLTAMKDQIDSRQAALAAQLAQLQATKRQLDRLLAAGENDAYNAGVDSYNGQVSSYNTSLSSLRTYIKAYNDLVTARNRVAEELNALNHAQDTRLQPESVPEPAPAAN